ncbi:MAG: ABC transporter permease subunit [Clostridia bacterium]|nr:ABC transporter permease subunit [Clostridia bacterium]
MAAKTASKRMDGLNKKSLGARMLEHWQLYMLILPAFITVIIFKYVPLYGIQLAFRSLKLGQTITQGKWVGWQNFERFFSSGSFSRTLGNTLKVGFATFLTFPLPIILALMLNNCVAKRVMKFSQTVTYIPYLVAVVLTTSIVLLFVNSRAAFLNIMFKRLGLPTISFLSKDKYVLPMYIISGIWTITGYNSIIYLSALSGVNPELIEASMVDGCSKLKRIWHIDLACIRPTIVILLIMNLGTFMNASTEKMLMIQTDLNLGASETIGTFTYKIGLAKRQYGYSTAVDLFTNVVNFVMLLSSNFIAKRVSGMSLF